MPSLLEARGLVKHLGGRRVVEGVDLVCRAGEVLGLLGPNGAGKTTTLRMLYGFLRPDAGEIRVDGSTDLARVKREIGVCTQNDTFDGDFNVQQNLEIASTYFRSRPERVPERVRELIEASDSARMPPSGRKPCPAGFAAAS
jgi:lipooligosaccharide transport system ATP-binding protein